MPQTVKKRLLFTCLRGVFITTPLLVEFQALKEVVSKQPENASIGFIYTLADVSPLVTLIDAETMRRWKNK